MIEHRGDWFQTYTGRKFHVLAPRAEDVCLEDVAHALSHLCRFAGHCLRFYSVAQHCVLVSRLVPERLALHGLLHDAAEAYTGDLIRPIKRSLREYTVAFDVIEAAVEHVVAQHFGLPPLDDEEAGLVKQADIRALATERRDLLLATGLHWESTEQHPPHEETIHPLAPVDARRLFLDRYAQLRSAVA